MLQRRNRAPLDQLDAGAPCIGDVSDCVPGRRLAVGFIEFDAFDFAYDLSVESFQSPFPSVSSTNDGGLNQKFFPISKEHEEHQKQSARSHLYAGVAVREPTAKLQPYA